MNKKKESKVVPNVRFKGFTDDWKQRKLTEIVNRVNKSSNSDVLPKVEFEDIVSGEGRLNKDISSKFDSRKGTLFEPENILYGKLRPYLKNWLFSDFGGVALGDFWVFEATDVSVPSFDYYLIQSDDYQKVANDTSGTKMPRSDWKNVSSTDFAIPSKDEQKQIGAFFKQLDDTITLRQQKITLLIKLKKAMLEKMFPKKGSVIPEIRFKGFANAWEQRKFDEVFDCTIPSNTLSRAELNYESGSVRNIHYGDILIKYGSVVDVKNDEIPFATGKSSEDFKSALLQDGDIIIADTAEDETTGKACEIGNSQGLDVVSGLHTMVCRPRNKMALGYLGYYLNSDAYHHQLLPLMQGIKVLSLSRTNVQKTMVCYPQSKAEQQLIADCFRNLDRLITLHQRKIDKLKNLKKAMLDQMLI